MRKLCLLLLVVTMVFCAGASLAADSVKAYTTLEEPLAKALFDQFEADNGIHVEWVRLSSGEAVARIEAERENPQASIWVGGVGTLHINAKGKGLTSYYRSRVGKTIPAKYHDPDNKWIGLYVGPIAFAMNTERAEELGISMPESWSDLIKPEYKGYIRVANPGTSGTAYNVVTTVIRVFGGEEEGFAYLKKLNKNVDQYTRSGSAPGKNCAIGEIPVAIGYLHDMIRLKEKGAPIEIAIPSDGTGFETASMSLIKGGPDPVPAKKLYDWVLGKKAQEIIAQWYVIPLSTRAKKADTGFSLKDMNLVDQDDQWDSVNKTRLVERWNEEVASSK